MVLKKILERQNIDVIECHEDIKNFFSFFSAYVKLFKKHRTLQYDVMIIPWKGIITLPLAKLVAKTPILHIGFISIYDTLVNDRRTVKEKSLKAKLIHLIEGLLLKLPDMIILDSLGEINYFVKEFNLDKKKFRRLFLSADETKFNPKPVKEVSHPFTVLYFGGFIPLHGVVIIIEAARLLSDEKDIVFKLCGKGQTKLEMEQLVNEYHLQNVEFLGFVSDEQLIKEIEKSDVCLGLLGRGEKAMKCVSNKAFEILCSQRALIALNSNGIKEIGGKNLENCILVPQNNPQELANSILNLKNDINLKKTISQNGRKLFVNNLSMKNVGLDLLKYLNELKSEK